MAPVEAKVKAATTGASLGVAASALATWALVRYVLPKDLDPVVQAEVVAAIPTVVGGVLAFVAGYLARHTPRTPVPVVNPPATPQTPPPPPAQK